MNDFDNHDKRIPYYELLLERDLDSIPKFSLPDGFRFEFYQNGDRDEWIEIEKSAKEFESFEQGVEAWNRYYLGKEYELQTRMVFIADNFGEKVATATAFYDVTGKDNSGAAWLHWVAVKREYQGKGLSKPLISYVLSLMKSMGYTQAKIPTQTTTWLAVKIYLDFGFLPIPQNAEKSYMGWSIIRQLTNHRSLVGFECKNHVMLIDIVRGINRYQYALFDEYKNDLSWYQSRILPDDHAELVCWKYICCDCKIIGSIWIEKATDNRFTLGIFIADNEYRNKGIGSQAIRSVIENTKINKLYLRVRKNNTRAINCYHKIGFTDMKEFTKSNGVEVIEMKYEQSLLGE